MREYITLFHEKKFHICTALTAHPSSIADVSRPFGMKRARAKTHAAARSGFIVILAIAIVS